MRTHMLVACVVVVLGVGGVVRGERTIFDMDEAPTIEAPAAPAAKPLPKLPTVAGPVLSPPATAATQPGPGGRIVADSGKAAGGKGWTRVKVPPAGELAAAERVMTEVYGDAFKAAKTGPERRVLAGQLRKGGKIEPDAASRFVLLRKGRDVAAEAGEAELAGSLIGDMAGAFEVEDWKLAAATVGPLAKGAVTAGQKQDFAVFCAAYAVKAMEGEDFAAGKALADAGVAAGVKDAKQSKRAAEIARGLREAEAAFAASTNAGADLDLRAGKYLCFYRGDWKEGLKKLAAANDAALAAAAKRELAGVGPESQVAVGDAWWEVAQKSEGFVKKRVQEHAGAFYKQALAAVAGAEKAKVKERLAAAGMEILEVPDFVVAYLDSIADKLPKGDEPHDAFRQQMSLAGRGGRTALQVNGQDRQITFLGKIQYIVMMTGIGSKPPQEPMIYRSVGVRFEYNGVLIEFSWRDMRHTTLEGVRALYAEWSQGAKAGTVYELTGPASGFGMFTTLPAADGRERITLYPTAADRFVKPANLTVKERP